MTLEDDRNRSRRSITVLGDDDVGLTGARGLLVVDVLAVQKDDDVSVLLQRTRLTQVAHHRLLVIALLRSTVELGEGDDRDLQLLGQ